MSQFTDEIQDDRGIMGYPIFARGPHLNIGNVAGATSAWSTSAFRGNGTLQAFKHRAGDLTTDTNYIVEIVDKDGFGVQSFMNIPDNETGWKIIPADNRPPIFGSGYTIKWHFTTSQIVGANVFEILFVFNREAG